MKNWKSAVLMLSATYVITSCDHEALEVNNPDGNSPLQETQRPALVDPATPYDATPFIDHINDEEAGRVEAPSGSDWQLVFSDEFDAGSLNSSKWSKNYPWGQTHNHQAWMAPENVYFNEWGKLVLEGKDVRHPDAPYSVEQGGKTRILDYQSGAIHSKGKFSMDYGFVEGSFKSTKALGTWPAFWMLSEDPGWPPEIDILEIPIPNAEARKKQHFYYHYGENWKNKKSFGTNKNHGVVLGDDFHTYGMEWGPNYMKFYFDGSQIGSWTNRPECSQAEKMYLIINMAIGGWPGTPPANASFPDYYKCDWVRVYQKSTRSIWNKGFNKKLHNSSAMGDDVNVADNQFIGNNVQWYLDNIDGTNYYIRHKATNRKLRDNNGDVHVAPSSYTGNQVRWRLNEAGNGYVYIVNNSSGQKLRYDGNTVHMGASSNAGDWVKWEILHP